jgi:hypothetical protein
MQTSNANHVLKIDISRFKSSPAKAQYGSDEASVFCYGFECRRLRKTFLQLGSYPLLALLVRAIKYLGIYRHEALPTFGQATRVLAKGALIVVSEYRRAVDPCLPASSNNQA